MHQDVADGRPGLGCDVQLDTTSGDRRHGQINKVGRENSRELRRFIGANLWRKHWTCWLICGIVLVAKRRKYGNYYYEATERRNGVYVPSKNQEPIDGRNHHEGENVEPARRHELENGRTRGRRPRREIRRGNPRHIYQLQSRRNAVPRQHVQGSQRGAPSKFRTRSTANLCFTATGTSP